MRVFERGFGVLLLTVLASAALPTDLSNFQNEYVCDTDIKLVRPVTVEHIQEAVQMHTSVVAVGVGHSWNKPFFCASIPDEQKDGEAAGGRRLKQRTVEPLSAANIVLSTISPLKIDVDEVSSSVWVDSGVIVWDLLRYLGNYVTESAPAGYTLPATPWFVYQTIGGALATGTHGSNLVHNSLSSQALAFKVVLANGTLTEITDASNSFLMKAMRISLGKLGIITSIKMKIVPEVPVKRNLRKGIGNLELLSMFKDAQEQYKKTRTLPEWMVESQLFWLPQLHEFALYTFQRGDVEDPALQQETLRKFEPEETTQFNSLLDMLGTDAETEVAAPSDEGRILDNGLYEEAFEFLEEYNAKEIQQQFESVPEEDIVAGVDWEAPEPLRANVVYGNEHSASPLLSSNYAALSALLGNATQESHLSYISMPQRLVASLIDATLYDQYEVAIQVDRIGDCMEGLMKLMYDDDIVGLDEEKRKVDKGFRTSPLIRFIGKEDAFLSPTNDMPRVYMNLEDYTYYNRGRKRNEMFFKLMGFLRGNPACGSPRLHWGKAGWPEEGCWDGSSEYEETWCDFGCAVRQLDPTNKFHDSASDRWNWEGAGLDACCTSEGYDKEKEGCTCSVKRIKSPEECPPAPFYTDR